MSAEKKVSKTKLALGTLLSIVGGIFLSFAILTVAKCIEIGEFGMWVSLLSTSMFGIVIAIPCIVGAAILSPRWLPVLGWTLAILGFMFFRQYYDSPNMIMAVTSMIIGVVGVVLIVAYFVIGKKPAAEEPSAEDALD